MPGLLVELAHRAHAVRLVALALVGVDGAAGEHPRAAHEPRLGVALDEQQLERVAAAAQQDDRRGLARDRLGRSSLSSSPGPGRSTSLTPRSVPLRAM